MSLFLLASLGFTAIALPDSLLGIAWPSMRATFHVPLSALGLLLPLGIGAYVLSSSATGLLLARLGVGRLLAASTAMSSAAVFGTAAAPSLWVVIAAGVLLGLASGAIDGGLNAYAARHFGAARITWMHASYCFGAIVGPVLIVATLGAGLSWRIAYACVAGIQLILAIAFVGTAKRWTDHDAEATSGRGPTKPAGPVPVRAIALGTAAVAVEAAIEGGVGLWAYVYLTEGRGMPEALAGMAISAYWAAMLLGRVVLGPLAARVGPARVLTAGVAGTFVATLSATLAPHPYVAAVGIVLIGLTAAPMFPLLTLTTERRVGAAHADRAIGLQVAASSVGGAALPALMGVVLDRVEPGALAPMLLVLAVVMGATWRAMSDRLE